MLLFNNPSAIILMFYIAKIPQSTPSVCSLSSWYSNCNLKLFESFLKMYHNLFPNRSQFYPNESLYKQIAPSEVILRAKTTQWLLPMFKIHNKIGFWGTNFVHTVYNENASFLSYSYSRHTVYCSITNYFYYKSSLAIK